MRQINFTIIFAFCLALALFSIENTQSAPIKIIPGVQVQAPLSIELIITMGFGAILAWLFSVWTGLQLQVGAFRSKREMRSKEEQIEVLEQEVEQWKAEVDKQKQLLPGSNAEVEVIS